MFPLDKGISDVFHIYPFCQTDICKSGDTNKRNTSPPIAINHTEKRIIHQSEQREGKGFGSV
jgi:hypothetical protein